MTEDLPDKPTQVVQDRVPAWAEYLLLAALPYLLYGHTLFYGLLGIDDTLYYFGNPALSEGRLEGLGRIFTTYYYSDYFPVTQFTLWLDVALFGTQSWFFARVHELAWFAAGVLAVRKLAGELVESRGLAFSVALLFALHPAGTSTAVWLAERKNVVGFALSFAALACYVSGRRKEGRESQARLAGAWVLLALALLAKTHAVAVPAMMFVYELTRGHGAWTRRLLVWFPFALLGATLVALSLTVFRNDLQQPPLGGSRAAALFAAGPILARYLAHTVAPFNLAFYYAVDEPGFESGYAWALWLAALGGPALLTLLSRPRGAVACGWLLGFAALLPALNLVPQPVPMSDHYHWWALPGWLLALAAALESAYTRGAPERARRWLSAWLALAVAGFAVLAVLESLLYGQPAELFLQAAKRQPESSWAHAANARGLKASSDARLRSLRGVAARHALEAPDAHRLLPQDRAFAIVEAALDLHRLGRPVEMLQLVDREASRIGDPWLEAVTRAEVGLGAKTPGIAIEALRPRFDPLFGAIAARLREACRAGEALPDALPPARVGTEIDDPFAGAAVREILRKGLFLLARAQVQKEDHEAAFEVAATLVNLYPGYEPGRLLLAEIYRRLGQPGAAERLDAPPAQRPAGV